MTVYAPAEHQPKLGRSREELTEVRISVWFSSAGGFHTLPPLSLLTLSTVYCRDNVEIKFPSLNPKIACHLENV